MVRACGDPGPMSRITTIAFPPVLGGTPWEPAACPTLPRCGQPTVQQVNCKPSESLVKQGAFTEIQQSYWSSRHVENLSGFPDINPITNQMR